MSEITESQQLLLSNLSYINFDVSEYENMEKLIKYLSEDEEGNTDYSNLKELNSKQIFYDAGILQDKPNLFQKKEWHSGGNQTQEEAIAAVEAIKNSPELMGMKIIAGEEYGVGSRNITLYSPATNEMVIACRGTGAEEWLKNGEAIRKSDTSELHAGAKTYLNETLEEMKSLGHDITKLNYVFTGHSNGGYKADVMTAETMKMLKNMGVSEENMNIRNALFDGFHVSDAFLAENPEIKSMYEKMAAQNKLLRFCGFNDFVHGLGGKSLKDNTIYIDKFNPDGGLLPQITAQQHFSGLFYTRDAAGNIIGTINGYKDGSFSTSVQQGPIAVLAEEFSINIVAMKNTVLADKIIHVVMGMMTKNKDSIPEDKLHDLTSMMGLLLDPNENREVMELLAKSLKSSREKFADEGREDEFWAAFDGYIDKSVIEKLMSFDYENGTDAELFDVVTLILVSFLQNNPDVQQSILDKNGLWAVKGSVRKFFNTVNRINIKNPPDELGYKFFSYLFSEINDVQEWAAEGKLIKEGLDLKAIRGSIETIYGKEIKNDGSFIKELEEALTATEGVVKTPSGRNFGGGSRSIPDSAFRGGGRSFGSETTTRTSSSGMGRSFGSVVVDNGELKKAVAALDRIEISLKSMRSSTQSLIRDLKIELNKGSKMTSSDKREIKSTIESLERIYDTLGSKIVGKGKRHFNFIMEETKKLESQAFTKLKW